MDPSGSLIPDPGLLISEAGPSHSPHALPVTGVTYVFLWVPHISLVQAFWQKSVVFTLLPSPAPGTHSELEPQVLGTSKPILSPKEKGHFLNFF